MIIAIPFSETEINVRDLFDLLDEHSESIVVDGDEQKILVENPDEYLLEELENRGVKFEKLEWL